MMQPASFTAPIQQPASRSFRSASVLGVRIHDVSAQDIVEFIVRTCQEGGKAIVSNANIHAMEIAGQQAWFGAFLNQSELVFCDGFGVSLASAVLGQGWLQRNTPPDWMEHLMPAAVQHNLSLYFLGTRQDIVEKAADALRSRFGALRVIGCHHGFFDKSRASAENAGVLREISQLRPDILVVGFGMPMQEEWISQNWSDLDVHVAVPVGAMFDFAAGETYRAPRWVTDHGLEWLSRLIVEPRRLWRRYAIDIPHFCWRVLLQRLSALRVA